MGEIMYRFKYVGGFNYKNYWVIQKRFLWLFWRNYKKIPYRLLEDGYPNINKVMDYVDWLNMGPNEYDDYSPGDLINVRKYKDE
jgi:hypothetical protein